MRDKPKTPFIGTTRGEGWIVAGALLVVTILVGVFFDEDRGWIAGISAGALACLIIISWPLRSERWFWALFAVFAGMNAFTVAHFDWSSTHDWSSRAVASLMIPDLGVMMAITYGVYCWIYGQPAEAVAELPDEGPSYSEREIL